MKNGQIIKKKSSINLGDVSEVQSMIDRGVKLNGEYWGNIEKPIPFQYPLHFAVGRHELEGTV